MSFWFLPRNVQHNAFPSPQSFPLHLSQVSWKCLQTICLIPKSTDTALLWHGRATPSVPIVYINLINRPCQQVRTLKVQLPADLCQQLQGLFHWKLISRTQRKGMCPCRISTAPKCSHAFFCRMSDRVRHCCRHKDSFDAKLKKLKPVWGVPSFKHFSNVPAYTSVKGSNDTTKSLDTSDRGQWHFPSKMMKDWKCYTGGLNFSEVQKDRKSGSLGIPQAPELTLIQRGS